MRHEEPFGSQEYIVNLTRQLVGGKTVFSLETEREAHPDALYLLLGPRLRKQLGAMTCETLGRICAFGHNKDMSEPLEGTFGFIRKTGIEEVCPHDYSHKLAGRLLCEEVAIRTIIAVLCDIVRQSEYEAERDKQNEFQREYDRTLTEYIHRGGGARTL